MANMKENLMKLQELQLKAYEYGLSMDINTRETNTDEPWIVGHVKTEDWIIGGDSNGYLHFDFYHFNPNEHESMLETIERFIESHHYVTKYGQQWEELQEDPRDTHSRLVVKIGNDEIYVNEFAGVRHLVEGGESTKFYFNTI